MTEPRRRRARTPTSATSSKTQLKISAVQSAKRADLSRQVDDKDQFLGYSESAALNTPYDMTGLAGVYERSNMLRQCVAAIVTNVTGFGWKITELKENQEIDEDEKDELQSFIEYANVEESLTTVNDKVVEDYEKYGFAFLEVIRDLSGRVSFLRHAPSFKTRLLKKDTRAITVKNTIYRGKRRAEVSEKRKFRRFVQLLNGKATYFKEFGDPRQLNYQTGEYETSDKKVPPQWQATEIIHIKQNSEEPYGVPRWISQLPSILGSRESEEVNLRYFEDNTVPPMILMVSGGRLTQTSYTDLMNLLQNEGIGKDRQNKILLIEAVPEKEGLDDKGTVSLQVEKLASERPSDGLFGEYDKANMDKVRSSFRLPPVIIGMSQDINFATASVSAFVAETQVFSTQRRRIEELYNKKIVNHPAGLGMKTCKLEAKAPAITNPEQVIKALTALNVMGAITPRKAIAIANESLQVSIAQLPEQDAEGWEPWMDQPIQLSIKEISPNIGSHIGSAATPTDVQQTQQTGDIGPTQPEHGQE